MPACMLSAVKLVRFLETRVFFAPEKNIGLRVVAAMLVRGIIARAIPQRDILGFAPQPCPNLAAAHEGAAMTAKAAIVRLE